jgi:cation:H+ antiporter
MLIAILLLLVGFVILIKGADFLVNGASSAAKKFGISNLAIGLTVVAFGTSAPELVVNVISAVNGNTDAAFGNIIGSNNFNLLFILGVAGIIYPLVVQKNTVRFEVPLSLLAAFVLFVLVNDSNLWGVSESENILSRIDAFILLGFFGLFMMYVYRTMKNTNDMGEGEQIKIYSTGLSVGMVILGLVMLVGGGKLVVDNAIDIAHYYGLSEKLIGLTILAAGNLSPRIGYFCVAAYRKNTDIAIGNVVGSNIFNIFFILGITGVIKPLRIPWHLILIFTY